MKAEFETPIQDRNVIITIKESELKSINILIGCMSRNQRNAICKNHTKYNDDHTLDFYKMINKLNIE